MKKHNLIWFGWGFWVLGMIFQGVLNDTEGIINIFSWLIGMELYTLLFIWFSYSIRNLED